MKNSQILIAITILLAGGFIWLAVNLNNINSGVASDPKNTSNITIENGKQVISISAKGGYVPKNTNAKANTPTVLKVNTQGTFDCSASLVIPDLNYKKFLPPSGETFIDIPPQKPGTNLRGICSMGMYNFNINFN